MKLKSKTLLVLLLVLVMITATACIDTDEIKLPANVSGDSSVTSGNTAEEINDTEPAEGNEEAMDVTVAETVLYEADGVKITATGLEDGWMGPSVTLLAENTSDKNIQITADSVSVNGYMMSSATLYIEVAAGKKANDSLSLMTSELDKAGIETVAQLQFYLNISDADDWSDQTTSDLITLNTSAAGLEQPVDDSGDVLYDADGIKVICKGLKQDIFWDGTIVFYMENNSGKPVTVYAENVSVNGFMEDASLWSDLRDGTRAINGLSLLDLSDLELDSIDQVQNIEFNLRVIHSETWDEIVTTDVISLNFA